MSYKDINDLPRSYGNIFPQSSGDGLLHSCKGEFVFPFLCNDETGHHLSSTLPPPPLVTLLTSRFLKVERYETTQSLLICKHKDGNYMCAHVLKMKSYIDKLGRMGI